MRATAIAHPNVALIKYWGKRDLAQNLPAVGSLSLTLAGLHTRTTVSFDPAQSNDRVILNGTSDEQSVPRVSHCLDLLRARAGISAGALVETSNDFPTGAGLASSASGYAALAMAAATALGLDTAADNLADIARIGSGSAPRSLYDGIVILRNTAAGTRCESVSAPEVWPLDVLVAVTSTVPKDVGSTEGMERSRTTSPYYQAWLDSHAADLEAALSYVQQRRFTELAELSEHSCLKMHSLAMSSRPPLLYWSAATLAAMHRVRELRAAGVPVFFTIDAGPQLKAVCLPEVSADVKAALAEVPGVLNVLECTLGRGARAAA